MSLTEDDMRQIKSAVDALSEKNDDIQKHLWIVAGVCGGVSLILLILVIWLAVSLSRLRLRQQVVFSKGRTEVTVKPGLERALTTKPDPLGNLADLRHAPPPHTYAQVPKNYTAEEELAQLGFSAYTGNQMDPRGLPTSPAVSNSGGVRVLPRNPPAGFRNVAGAYNDGYM